MTERDVPTEDGTSAERSLLDRAEAADFRTWYRERRRRENARAGNFQYIGPGDPPPADTHYPHTLLTCHRKRHYEEANAPVEDPKPLGYFRMGRDVESELVVPFLEEHVAGPDQRVTRSVGFQTAIETGSGSFRLRGKTDPAITTADGDPLLVTEVKTVGEVDREEPRETHLAQVHAYLAALADRLASRQAAILYISRTSLELRAFPVRFDEDFWTGRVVPWLQERTAGREDDELPPATPEQEWECTYCSYRRRCGQSDHPAADEASVGFLPRHRYPRAAVEAHLAAHDAPLTPTLAAAYPELAAEHEVAGWDCPACRLSAPFGTLDWDGDPSEPPPCPRCAATDQYVELTPSTSITS